MLNYSHNPIEQLNKILKVKPKISKYRAYLKKKPTPSSKFLSDLDKTKVKIKDHHLIHRECSQDSNDTNGSCQECKEGGEVNRRSLEVASEHDSYCSSPY